MFQFSSGCVIAWMPRSLFKLCVAAFVSLYSDLRPLLVLCRFDPRAIGSWPLQRLALGLHDAWPGHAILVGRAILVGSLTCLSLHVYMRACL